MKHQVTFPPAWVNTLAFEGVLQASALSPHSAEILEVSFIVPTGCSLMVDAATKLLSLANQLVATTKRVRLVFEDARGTMGYLDRMGFFDLLDGGVVVEPTRPLISGAAVYAGENQHLVEFQALDPKNLDQDLPGRLTDRLLSTVKGGYRNNKKFEDASFTIFTELIQNVYRHSETTLRGAAAMQSYARGGKCTVCVSDSGLGLVTTLRPALKQHFPKLAKKTDPELLLEMVSSGVSRFGRDNGCGIRQCARKALAFNASMHVRLYTSKISFTPTPGTGSLGIGYYEEGLPEIWGTHISVDFPLDGKA